MSLYAGIFEAESAPQEAAAVEAASEAAPAPEAPAKAWSAALGFAPVVRKKPAKAQIKPAAVISAAPVVYAAELQTLQTDEGDVNGFRKTEAGQKSNRSSRKVICPCTRRLAPYSDVRRNASGASRTLLASGLPSTTQPSPMTM
jgi:hypothetical protein